MLIATQVAMKKPLFMESPNRTEKAENATLPVKLGTTPLLRLSSLYERLYEHEFNVKPRVLLRGRDGGVLKSLLKSFSEVQIAVLMIVHFNWYGMSGNDEWQYDKLRENCFPLSWISVRANNYIAYLSEMEDLDISDTKQIKQYITDYMRDANSNISSISTQ